MTMPDDPVPSAWLDDPSQERAAVRDIPAICPRCAEPVLNPVPVLVCTPNVAEAWCTCPNEHLFIVRWTDFDTTPTPESEAA